VGVPGNLLQIGGTLSCGVQACQQPSHTGARDAVDGDAVFFKESKHSDMSESPSSSTAQGETDAWPMGLGGLLSVNRQGDQKNRCAGNNCTASESSLHLA
jgi:hypothetical protein